MTLFLPKYFARKGTPLKPCLRCGSEKLIGHDSKLDGLFEISCYSCGQEHIGAFGEATAESWNKASPVGDYRPLYGGQPKGGDVGHLGALWEERIAEADERGIIGKWNCPDDELTDAPRCF